MEIADLREKTWGMGVKFVAVWGRCGQRVDHPGSRGHHPCRNRHIISDYRIVAIWK